MNLKLKGSPRKYRYLLEDMNNSMAVPLYTDYITANMTKTIELTIAQGKVANYQVRRDKSVLIDKTVHFQQSKR